MIEICWGIKCACFSPTTSTRRFLMNLCESVPSTLQLKLRLELSLLSISLICSVAVFVPPLVLVGVPPARSAPRSRALGPPSFLLPDAVVATVVLVLLQTPLPPAPLLLQTPPLLQQTPLPSPPPPNSPPREPTSTPQAPPPPQPVAPRALLHRLLERLRCRHGLAHLALEARGRRGACARRRRPREDDDPHGREGARGAACRPARAVTP